MARDSASEGNAEGAKLASGFIALSVKYSGAMQQIGKDLRALEDTAAVSGARAGRAHGRGLAEGAAEGARAGRRATLREWAETETEANTRSERIASKMGRTFGAILSAPIRVPLRAMKGGFKELEETGTKSIGAIVPAGGLATAAIAGIGTEAVAVAGPLAAAVGILGTLLKVGSDWNGIQRNLQFTTGLDGPALQQQMNMIAQIGKEIPASFEQVGDVSSRSPRICTCRATR